MMNKELRIEELVDGIVCGILDADNIMEAEAERIRFLINEVAEELEIENIKEEVIEGFRTFSSQAIRRNKTWKVKKITDAQWVTTKVMGW